MLIHAAIPPASTARTIYLLNCGGCHGIDGISNSRLVPDLKGQVGYFLSTPEGRRYLIQLPNVAFSETNDRTLTDLMNYVVFSLGAGSVPEGSAPYTPDEVSIWRRHPLTEVSLAALRNDLVQTLIDRHHASTGLRRYGEALYAQPAFDPNR